MSRRPDQAAAGRVVRKPETGPRRFLGCTLAGLALAGLLLVSGASVADARPSPSEAVIEARVKSLALELRCLVCQNQTIADSQADLAVDLRARIREQIAAGATDEDIRRYMVERYGEFVLYRPALHASTALLWFGPALLVVLGLAALAASLRRRANAPSGDDPDDSLAEGRTTGLAGHPASGPAGGTAGGTAGGLADRRAEESHPGASNRSGQA